MKKLTAHLLAGGLAVVVPGQVFAEGPFNIDLPSGTVDLEGFSALITNRDQAEVPVRFRGLLTTWHSGAPAEMAFIRPGMEWPDLSGKLVVITETPDAAAQLNPLEWTNVIEMDLAVPVFGQNIPGGLSREELAQIMNGDLSGSWIACCANMGLANAPSNFQYFSREFGVDPNRMREVVEQSAQWGLTSYPRIQNYMEAMPQGQPNIAIGLRGVPMDSSLNLVPIDGYRPGETAYPLQMQSNVYIRRDSPAAIEMLQRSLDFEAPLIRLDLEQMDLLSGN